jgi:hypothetical protein
MVAVRTTEKMKQDIAKVVLRWTPFSITRDQYQNIEEKDFPDLIPFG